MEKPHSLETIKQYKVILFPHLNLVGPRFWLKDSRRQMQTRREGVLKVTKVKDNAFSDCH